MGTAARVVDDLRTPLSAADQMAADLALLDAVRAGAPLQLRLYRWHTPALSLGRFQGDGDVDRAACEALGVDVVRRPTGGRALLHGADLTYAVAILRPSGADGTVVAVYERIARGLIAGLDRLGVDAGIAHHRGATDAACFASQRGSDLRVGGRKLVGSAQLRSGGAVLQHGAVLLDRLPFDETDLLATTEAAAREDARRQLRAATVTLAELGVKASADDVAAALVAGISTALDLDLDFRSRSFVAAAAGSQ